MAGGPIFPISAEPVTAGIGFPFQYNGAGAVEDREMMMGVADATDVVADVTVWHLVFVMPPTSLPTGTGKLRLLLRANATSGVQALNVAWKSVAVGEDPSTGALNDEGSVDTTWAAGDADDYKQQLLTLDADTLVASEMVHMNIDVDNAAHTIAVETGIHASVIWE